MVKTPLSLSGPIPQEIHITTSFQSLGLSAELLRAVADQGYTEATPIQAQAIPVVLSGRDLLAAAQTGTGKTAGFTLPILQLLSTRITESNVANNGKPVKHPVRVLILTPTRELCAQVNDSVATLDQMTQQNAALVEQSAAAAESLKDQSDRLAALVSTFRLAA